MRSAGHLRPAFVSHICLFVYNCSEKLYFTLINIYDFSCSIAVGYAAFDYTLGLVDSLCLNSLWCFSAN